MWTQFLLLDNYKKYSTASSTLNLLRFIQKYFSKCYSILRYFQVSLRFWFTRYTEVDIEVYNFSLYIHFICTFFLYSILQNWKFKSLTNFFEISQRFKKDSTQKILPSILRSFSPRKWVFSYWKIERNPNYLNSSIRIASNIPLRSDIHSLLYWATINLVTDL